jgi:hypothetical protein
VEYDAFSSSFTKNCMAAIGRARGCRSAIDFGFASADTYGRMTHLDLTHVCMLDFRPLLFASVRRLDQLAQIIEAVLLESAERRVGACRGASSRMGWGASPPVSPRRTLVPERNGEEWRERSLCSESHHPLAAPPRCSRLALRATRSQLAEAVIIN